MDRLTARGGVFAALTVVLALTFSVFDFGWVDLINGFAPGDASDRVLSGGYGTIAGIIIPIGLLAQLHAPVQQISGLLQVVLAALAFLLVGILGADRTTVIFSFILTGAVVLLWALHPARRSFFNWRPNVSLSLLAITLVAAGPLLAYAWQLASNQRNNLPQAAEAVRVGMGGWIGNAAMALGILFVALLVALRPSGWRVSAWSVGVAAFLFGLDLLLFPSVPGSPGTAWGIAAMMWSVVFIGVAERLRFAAEPLRASVSTIEA